MPERQPLSLVERGQAALLQDILEGLLNNGHRAGTRELLLQHLDTMADLTTRHRPYVSPKETT